MVTNIERMHVLLLKRLDDNGRTWLAPVCSTACFSYKHSLQIMHAGQCCVAVDAAAVILPKGNGPSCAKQLQDMKIMG